jgi:hypothetical protein
VAAGAGVASATPQKAPAPPEKAPAPSAPVQSKAPSSPPAPAPANGHGAAPKQGGNAAGGDFVDEIIAALDATFTPAGDGHSGSGDLIPGPAAQDAQRNKESVDLLFAEIAATYAQPIRDFIVEVKKGTATKDWFEIARPALKSIGQAAKAMQLPHAAQRMEELDAALQNALQSGAKKIEGQIRDAILQRYQKIVEVMPQAFSLEEASNAAPSGTGPKDGVIINSLLKQIPEVSRLTLEKIYAAGLTSLDMLLRATPKELVQTTGIQIKLAEQIIQKIKEYKDESAKKDDKATPAQGQNAQATAYRQRLQHLNTAMRRAHDGFERAGATSDEDAKRKLRGERKNCAFQISIVLAELGEVALVKELDKLTFERRIQTVDEYLARTSKR